MTKATKTPGNASALVPTVAGADKIVLLGDDKGIVVHDQESFNRAMAEAASQGEDIVKEVVFSIGPGQALWNVECRGEGPKMEIGEEKMRLVNGQPTGELVRDRCRTWKLFFDQGKGLPKWNIRLIGKHALNVFLETKADGTRVGMFRHLQPLIRGARVINTYDLLVIGKVPFPPRGLLASSNIAGGTVEDDT